MQGTELFLSLAEIAGVFVGFGALIAVRSGATMEGSEINSIRWVVTIAIWVVIAALAPILISSYGVTGHGPWLVCSLLALVLFVVLTVVYGRAPENRADVAATVATMPLAKVALLAGFTVWLPMVILVLALALVALGFFPNQEQALYLTAVGLGLFMGAMTLLGAVFSPGRAPTASEPSQLPAPGGSSAP
jgi:hypothetical protein